MFRKKKSKEPKYYKTMGWHWEYLLFWPMGWSMRAVTEYDPNDTFQLSVMTFTACIPVSSGDGQARCISPLLFAQCCCSAFRNMLRSWRFSFPAGRCSLCLPTGISLLMKGISMNEKSSS